MKCAEPHSFDWQRHSPLFNNNTPTFSHCCTTIDIFASTSFRRNWYLYCFHMTCVQNKMDFFSKDITS